MVPPDIPSRYPSFPAHPAPGLLCGIVCALGFSVLNALWSPTRALVLRVYLTQDLILAVTLHRWALPLDGSALLEVS